jgi:hypothetical protein
MPTYPKETDHQKLSEMVAELKCLADKKGSVAGRGYGCGEVSSFQSVVHLQSIACAPYCLLLTY